MIQATGKTTRYQLCDLASVELSSRAAFIGSPKLFTGKVTQPRLRSRNSQEYSQKVSQSFPVAVCRLSNQVVSRMSSRISLDSCLDKTI